MKSKLEVMSCADRDLEGRTRYYTEVYELESDDLLFTSPWCDTLKQAEAEAAVWIRSTRASPLSSADLALAESFAGPKFPMKEGGAS